MLKRAGQSLDLAVVTAVAMESVGVTPSDVHTWISSYSNTVLTHYWGEREWAPHWRV